MKIVNALFNLVNIAKKSGIEKLVHTVANIISIAITYFVLYLSNTYLPDFLFFLNFIVSIIGLVMLAYFTFLQAYIFVLGVIGLIKKVYVSNIINMILSLIILGFNIYFLPQVWALVF